MPWVGVFGTPVDFDMNVQHVSALTLAQPVPGMVGLTEIGYVKWVVLEEGRIFRA